METDRLKSKLSTEFAGPDGSPGFLLWQVANAWQRRQRQALDRIGLTHVQFVLMAGLGVLDGDGTPITQATLARHSRVDEMMTSQVVRALERRGAVTRHPHPSDSRAKVVSLTKDGTRLLQEALPLVRAADDAFFTAAGDGLADLVETLRKIADASRDREDEDGDDGEALRLLTSEA